jgi:uncharacterized peroxidase-related enzyme
MGYLREAPLDETNFPPFAHIKTAYGFIPNLFKAQTLRPDIIQANLALGNLILRQPGALSRKDKEYIFLVCSAANLSTYCVTAHCEIIKMLKLEGPEPEEIAVDFPSTNLPLVTKALLHFARKLTTDPTKVTATDVDALRTYGYTDEQILEAVLVVSWAKFANFNAFGLGTLPDFDTLQIKLYPGEPAKSATGEVA